MDQSVTKENKVKRSPKYKCEHCDKVYVRSQLLADHVRSKHEYIENKCQKCQKNFSSHETLTNHCRTVHNGFNYSCPDCPKQFKDRSSLYRHTKSIHSGIKHKCSKCDKEYNTRGSLVIHVRTIHEAIRHKCDTCQVEFGQKRHLSKHILDKHSNDKWKCDCQRIFASWNTLTSHIKSKHFDRENVQVFKLFKDPKPETDLDKDQLDIDIIIKEEIMEDFQHDFDIPSIKVSEPFEPMKIPKFLKEVSVSLQKLNKSEILKHTQAKGEPNVKNIKIHMYKHPTLMLRV